MRGKFFIEREIFESDIWEKPSHFLKIWFWIIGKANYKEVKKGGKIYRRGEFLTSFEETIEANKWKIGWRTERLTKDQVWEAYDFFRRTQRITTKKTTRGLWVKVLNYDYFQTLSPNEANNEPNSEANRVATVSQHGKRKKEKKDINNEPSSPVREIIAYFRDQVKEIRGFDPEINWGKDGKLAKQRLVKYRPEQLKDLITWYLGSKDSERLGVSLATCLSAYIINLWLEDTT